MGNSERGDFHAWSSAPLLPADRSRRDRASQSLSRAQFHLVQAQSAGLAVEDIAGVSGTSIALKLTLPAVAAGNNPAGTARRFLMFRGIPDPLTLSSGFRTRNAWVVSADHAGGLRLNVPGDYSGAFSVEVLLYRGETESPERQMLSVKISAPTRPAAAPPEVSALQTPAAKPAEAPHDVSPVSTEELELLSRGQEHLRNGNIVFARALFEELAARGSARGAFAVAQTYDPAVLEQIGAVGVQGDSEQAKRWYRKAAELGNVVPVDMMSALKKERPAE